MNRILLNALQYEKNGAGISKYTQKLLETFINQGYPVDILMRKEVVDKYNNESNIISVDKAISSSMKRIVEEQYYQRARYKEYELVHFPDYASPIFYTGNKVVTIHDMAMHTMKDKYTIMQNVTKRSLLEVTVRTAKHLICDSEFTKRELLQYYPNIKADLSVIHLGIEQPKVGLSEMQLQTIIKNIGIRNKYILCVGTLAPHKNIAHLIEVFSEIKKKNPEYQLVIAGKKGWMYEEIFKCVKEKHLKDEVIFTGFIDEVQLEALYRKADIYISLSLYEGFGLPPLEAMIRGCPVVVSGLEIFKETCREGALFCSPSDIGDAVKQVQYLIDNPLLRSKLIDLGLQRAKQFDWNITARKTYEVYEEVLHSEGEKR